MWVIKLIHFLLIMTMSLLMMSLVVEFDAHVWSLGWLCSRAPLLGPICNDMQSVVQIMLPEASDFVLTAAF
jgi:hypothetical protein